MNKNIQTPKWIDLRIEMVEKNTKISILLLNNFIPKDVPLIFIPRKIFKLTKLKRLDILHNEITIIPKDIGKLINLTDVDFSHNQIEIIPKEFYDLVNLQIIDFKNNKIQKISPLIGKLTKLNYLNLSENNIKFLPLCNKLTQHIKEDEIQINKNPLYKKLFTFLKDTPCKITRLDCIAGRIVIKEEMYKDIIHDEYQLNEVLRDWLQEKQMGLCSKCNGIYYESIGKKILKFIKSSNFYEVDLEIPLMGEFCCFECCYSYWDYWDTK